MPLGAGRACRTALEDEVMDGAVCDEMFEELAGPALEENGAVGGRDGWAQRSRSWGR